MEKINTHEPEGISTKSIDSSMALTDGLLADFDLPVAFEAPLVVTGVAKAQTIRAHRAAHRRVVALSQSVQIDP